MTEMENTKQDLFYLELVQVEREGKVEFNLIGQFVCPEPTAVGGIPQFHQMYTQS